MVLLSKEDKEIWKKYTLNMDKLRINIEKLEVKPGNHNLNKENKKKINDNTFDKFLRLLNKNRIEPDGIIDLHGYRLKEAKIKLENYIFQAFNNNKRNILIITGKGVNNSGLLKKEVPTWLAEKKIQEILISYKSAPRSFGGEGALIIRLKNKLKISI